jgi:hypothetical protein
MVRAQVPGAQERVQKVIYTTWNIWKERCSRVLDDRGMTAEQLQALIIHEVEQCGAPGWSRQTLGSGDRPPPGRGVRATGSATQLGFYFLSNLCIFFSYLFRSCKYLLPFPLMKSAEQPPTSFKKKDTKEHVQKENLSQNPNGTRNTTSLKIQRQKQRTRNLEKRPGKIRVIGHQRNSDPNKQKGRGVVVHNNHTRPNETNMRKNTCTNCRRPCGVRIQQE